MAAKPQTAPKPTATGKPGSTPKPHPRPPDDWMVKSGDGGGERK
jgi:hypothetical protein